MIEGIIEIKHKRIDLYMKKRISLIIAFLLSVLSVCAAMADTKAPVLPDGDLKVMDVRLKPDQVWEVYTGPGPEYAVANNGKARVNTRDWVQVLGGEDGEGFWCNTRSAKNGCGLAGLTRTPSMRKTVPMKYAMRREKAIFGGPAIWTGHAH